MFLQYIPLDELTKTAFGIFAFVELQRRYQPYSSTVVPTPFPFGLNTTDEKPNKKITSSRYSLEGHKAGRLFRCIKEDKRN
jgi:hypothetical protein